MDLGMYVVGAIIFGAYMWFTVWNIVYNGNKQEEENKKTIEYDSIDYDGMGNFSRFPSSDNKPSTPIKRKKITLK